MANRFIIVTIDIDWNCIIVVSKVKQSYGIEARRSIEKASIKFVHMMVWRSIFYYV